MQGSARDFLKPKLVDSVELSKNEYRVVLEPFERGFGHTLGNSIRRTLLSSMVGSAITEVAIDGVMHEFSSIEGVQEDVLDILLNLKEASIGLNASESATVIIEKEGPSQLTVADIETNGVDVSVFNPEKVIATINEGGKIRMTLSIATGVLKDQPNCLRHLWSSASQTLTIEFSNTDKSGLLSPIEQKAIPQRHEVTHFQVRILFCDSINDETALNTNALSFCLTWVSALLFSRSDH